MKDADARHLMYAICNDCDRFITTDPHFLDRKSGLKPFCGNLLKLLRASNTIKEIEFAATLPPVDIQRLSVDLLFENFERNETHLWPREEDIRGSRHEIHVISDEGNLLKSFDIREIIKEAGLKFLGRAVNIQV